MSELELRLECLRLATAANGKQAIEDLLAAAERIEAWIKPRPADGSRERP
jgi:hypothetical protein